MSEDKAIYGDSLDKVIEGNNSIYSRLTTLENKITAMISLYKDVVIDQGYLEKRVRALEQKDSYYPNMEELRKLRGEGTD
uniref:Uncharacterized protein n=1 Tax=viral metagenome TaxID=1070528 RepID=A0A6H1ZXT4_9ZZZZ